MQNNDPEEWIIRKMIIELTPKQLLECVCQAKGISLGKSEIYLSDLKVDDSFENITLTIDGME